VRDADRDPRPDSGTTLDLDADDRHVVSPNGGVHEVVDGNCFQSGIEDNFIGQERQNRWRIFQARCKRAAFP
jgi:hypothetical protein